MQTTGATASKQPSMSRSAEDPPKTPQYSTVFITISLAVVVAAGTFARALGFRGQHGPLLFDSSSVTPLGEQRGGRSRPLGPVWRRHYTGFTSWAAACSAKG